MKQTYTFRFEKATHDKLKREASKRNKTISAYLESLVEAEVSPATQEEIIDQVVADMPNISEEISTTEEIPMEWEVVQRTPVEEAIAAIREEQLY